MRSLSRLLLAIALMLLAGAVGLRAAEKEKPVKRDYSLVTAAPAPRIQTEAQMAAKSDGCFSCHVRTDQPTMHETPAVRLGCVDCHGGNAEVFGNSELAHDDPAEARGAAMPRMCCPNIPKAGTGRPRPIRNAAALLNKKTRSCSFVNPGDYRGRNAVPAISRQSRRPNDRSCHRAMLCGVEPNNNGILPFKRYILGEAYARWGAREDRPGVPAGTVTDAQEDRGAMAALYPMPTWHVIPPGDVFPCSSAAGAISPHPEVDIHPTGLIQQLEAEAAIETSTGAGLRVAIPVPTSTRLNDPSCGSWGRMTSRAIIAIRAAQLRGLCQR